MSSAELTRSLDLIEIKPGTKFSLATLKALLPDVETMLFFAKVYELDARQLGHLLLKVLGSDLSRALFAEGAEHSNDLQDYLIGHYGHDEDCPAHDWAGRECTCPGNWVAGIIDPAQAGDVTFAPVVPKGEILPEVWTQLEVTVAQSIKDVAAKLESVVNLLPGKQGSMVFGSMMKLNARRPTIGDYRASITHARQKENLLILDVSGSMTPGTIQRIIDDVVALSYTANAHMAVVSNTTTYWQPGTYSVDDVLASCEFGGTHYETLQPLFDRDWGVVITVADYDSSPSARTQLSRCKGRIDQVLDVSLVGRPTYLAECVGQLAAEVTPLLIGTSDYVLT
jgi:hypothetical protein